MKDKTTDQKFLELFQRQVIVNLKVAAILETIEDKFDLIDEMIERLEKELEKRTK